MMDLRRSARAGRSTRPLLFVLALALVALGFCPAFVPAAARAPAAAALAGAVAAVPTVAFADLPPLEDEVANTITSNQGTFMGINVGILVVVGFVGAIAYAFTVVGNVELEDKGYKTYFGGGDLPPEGFTNPLDPRMEYLEAAGEEDPLYAEGKKAKQQAASAVV
jgi:hypothetical protein